MNKKIRHESVDVILLVTRLYSPKPSVAAASWSLTAPTLQPPTPSRDNWAVFYSKANFIVGVFSFKKYIIIYNDYK